MSFKITIDSNKESFPADDDKTILESALEHGHSFPYGCRNGACGSCKGKLLEGKIYYKNEIPPFHKKLRFIRSSNKLKI